MLTDLVIAGGIGLTAVGATLLVRSLWRTKAKVITVIDGDTVVAVTRTGKKVKMRLWGIDAPEVGQPLSSKARQRLIELTHGKWVTVQWRRKDIWGRYLVSIFVGRKNVAKELVRSGLAFPARGSGMAMAAFVPRLLRRGVWSFWQPRPEHALSRKLARWGIRLGRRRSKHR